MTQIQTKVWAPRPAPFKPKAIDADNDGIVQEGTIWERPAGANFVDAAGNVLDALLTALPSGARMVDAKGSPIKEYTPKALRGKPPTAAAPKQGFRANTLGGMTGTLGTRYGTLESRYGTLESTRGTIGDQRTVVGDIERRNDFGSGDSGSFKPLRPPSFLDDVDMRPESKPPSDTPPKEVFPGPTREEIERVPDPPKIMAADEDTPAVPDSPMSRGVRVTIDADEADEGRKSYGYWYEELFGKTKRKRIDIDSPEYADAPSASPERREIIVEDFREAVDAILDNIISGMRFGTKKGKTKSVIKGWRAHGLNNMADIAEEWLDAKGDADKQRAVLNDYMFGANAHGATEMWDIPDAVHEEFATLVEGIYGEDKMRNAIAVAGTKHVSLAKNFVFAAMEGDESLGGVNLSGGPPGKVAQVGLGEIALHTLTDLDEIGKVTVGGWCTADGADQVIRHEYAHHMDKALQAASENRETDAIFTRIWMLMRLRAWEDSGHDELFAPKDAVNILRGMDADQRGMGNARVFEAFTRSADAAGMGTAEELATIVAPIAPSMYGFTEPAELFAEVFALTTNRDYDEATHIGDNWREAAQFMNTLHGHLESGGSLDTFVGALEEAGLGKDRMNELMHELIAGLTEANRQAAGLDDLARQVAPKGDG